MVAAKPGTEKPGTEATTIGRPQSSVISALAFTLPVDLAYASDPHSGIVPVDGFVVANGELVSEVSRLENGGWPTSQIPDVETNLYFNRLYDHQTETARKHSTFRLLAPGQSQIYTTDLQNIEHVLKTNFDKYAKGECNQDVFRDLFGTGIFAVDGDKWRQQRKVASFEFSTRVLRDFSCTVFRRSAIKLVRKVEEYSQANQVFDMQDLLMRSTLESIFKVGFGVDLNCIEGEGQGSSKEESIMFMKAFDDSNELTYWRYVDPFWTLKRYFNIGFEASLRKNIKIIHDFVDKLITARRKQLDSDVKSEKEDILSRFIRESKKDPETMTDEYLRDIILNFVIAGKDSSANTLSWFFYMLCKNPLVGEKLDREIEEVFGNLKEKASSSVEDCIASITDDEVLQKMPYLHATLTETLRLYPAVPIDGRCAETDDVLPDGFKVKKGDGVYYMSYAMGRMPYIWGDDAEEFRPERWLKDGIFTPESPFKFTAFHSLESPGINSTEELEPRSTIENAFVRSALQLFNQRSTKVRFVKLLNPCRLESLFADAERKPVFYLSAALGRRKGS
nr:cytochrome P450 704C1-like [Ipomoea batatas]